ncbi:MAG: dipeptidase PepE [Prevotellaceae bacterium]|jgi:dipeptidase E|nr:dipeptidase PepE [Prevotellaceae bacterium]
MNLLLLSNSTLAGDEYLAYAKGKIQSFLAARQVTEILFIPYAAVSFSYDEYLAKVQKVFGEFEVQVRGIHCEPDPLAAVAAMQAIVVGGGNTFHLLQQVWQQGLIEPVREKVRAGTPYIGWSAGANMACPTICTTNDMPIVQPQSFEAFDLIPFQINPHYTDVKLQNFAGETRDDRIGEYICANEGKYVVGLREGCMFLLENGKLRLVGTKPAKIFKNGQDAREIAPDEDFGFLL